MPPEVRGMLRDIFFLIAGIVVAIVVLSLMRP
jgi:hypothetical protein